MLIFVAITTLTGFWDENEKKMIRTLLKKYLEKNNYKHIFIHLPENITNFVKDIFEKPTITCVNNPISQVAYYQIVFTIGK